MLPVKSAFLEFSATLCICSELKEIPASSATLYAVFFAVLKFSTVGFLIDWATTVSTVTFVLIFFANCLGFINASIPRAGIFIKREAVAGLANAPINLAGPSTTVPSAA